MKISLLFVLFGLASSYAASVESQPRAGPIIWQEEFDLLDRGRWKHLITAWRGGNNEFQYYDNLPENRYLPPNRKSCIQFLVESCDNLEPIHFKIATYVTESFTSNQL